MAFADAVTLTTYIQLLMLQHEQRRTAKIRVRRSGMGLKELGATSAQRWQAPILSDSASRAALPLPTAIWSIAKVRARGPPSQDSGA